MKSCPSRSMLRMNNRLREMRVCVGGGGGGGGGGGWGVVEIGRKKTGGKIQPLNQIKVCSS